MKSGFKLLFISKQNSILQKFQTEVHSPHSQYHFNNSNQMPYNIETKLIRDMPNPKMKGKFSFALLHNYHIPMAPQD